MQEDDLLSITEVPSGLDANEWHALHSEYIGNMANIFITFKYFYLRLGAWVITAIVVGSLFGLIFCCIIPGYCVFKHLRK